MRAEAALEDLRAEMVRRDETVARASKANELYERDARDARAAATRAETKAAKAEA